MSRWKIAITAVGCLAALAGCGSSSKPIDPAVQGQLRQDVSALASDVAAHKMQQAQADWNALNAELAAARTAGKITSAKFSEIRTAMDAVFGDLQSPSPPASPSAAPSPTDEHGKGKDKSSSSSSAGGGGDNGDGG